MQYSSSRLCHSPSSVTAFFYPCTITSLILRAPKDMSASAFPFRASVPNIHLDSTKNLKLYLFKTCSAQIPIPDPPIKITYPNKWDYKVPYHLNQNPKSNRVNFLFLFHPNYPPLYISYTYPIIHIFLFFFVYNVHFNNVTAQWWGRSFNLLSLTYDI